jgi:hypothetical protein
MFREHSVDIDREINYRRDGWLIRRHGYFAPEDRDVARTLTRHDAANGNTNTGAPLLAVSRNET